MKIRRNWFGTLNESLESENLVEFWPVGSNIEYGDTIQHNDGIRLISVYRDSAGMYERPVYYSVV